MPDFRTYAMMSEQHVGDFKLIYHLSCFAGRSVNDVIDLKLNSCTCALLDYSIDNVADRHAGEN